MRRLELLSVGLGALLIGLSGGTALAQSAPYDSGKAAGGIRPQDQMGNSNDIPDIKGYKAGDNGTVNLEGSQGMGMQAANRMGKPLPQQDQTFLQTAAQDNMAEIKLSQLALDKSQSPMVKTLATHLLKDHTSSLANLKKVATRQNLSLPDSCSAEQQATYDRLSSLSGKDFDAAFVEELTQDHQTAINAFQQETEEGQDAGLKSYARTTLPTLKKHENMARMDSHKL